MNLMKRLVSIFVLICLIVTLYGCSQASKDTNNNNDNENNNNQNTNRNVRSNVVMTINGVDIEEYQFLLMMYDEAVNFRDHYPIPEGLSEEEYEDWNFNFWNMDLDGKSHVEIVKEYAVTEAKRYAYNKLVYKESGIELSDAEIIDIETSILQELNLSASENPDGYFKSKYGVSRDEFLAFETEKRIFEISALAKMKDETIPETEIREYYDTYKDFFSNITVSAIYISLLDSSGEIVDNSIKKEKKEFAEGLLSRIKNGEDMKDLIKEYSEDPDKDKNKGVYKITSDFAYEYELVEWAFKASVGDLDVVESEEGIFVVRCDDIGGYEDAKEEIVKIKKLENFKKNMEEEIKKEIYNAELNQEIYNSIESVPGDLDLSQSMG